MPKAKPKLAVVEQNRKLDQSELRDLAVGQACRVLTLEEAGHLAEIWLQKVGGTHIEDDQILDSSLERLGFWLVVKRRLQEASVGARRVRG